MYGDMLESDLKNVKKLENTESFDVQYDAACGFSWKRLSGKKDETVSDEKKEAVKKSFESRQKNW